MKSGGWLTGTPKPGEYLVVDRVYRYKSVATYNAALGWCINGRWLGQDAVECYQSLPDLPPDPDKA